MIVESDCWYIDVVLVKFGMLYVWVCCMMTKVYHISNWALKTLNVTKKNWLKPRSINSHCPTFAKYSKHFDKHWIMFTKHTVLHVFADLSEDLVICWLQMNLYIFLNFLLAINVSWFWYQLIFTFISMEGTMLKWMPPWTKKSYSEYSLLFASEAFKVKKYKFLFLVEQKNIWEKHYITT